MDSACKSTPPRVAAVVTGMPIDVYKRQVIDKTRRGYGTEVPLPYDG